MTWSVRYCINSDVICMKLVINSYMKKYLLNIFFKFSWLYWVSMVPPVWWFFCSLVNLLYWNPWEAQTSGTWVLPPTYTIAIISEVLHSLCQATMDHVPGLLLSRNWWLWLLYSLWEALKSKIWGLVFMTRDSPLLGYLLGIWGALLNCSDKPLL